MSTVVMQALNSKTIPDSFQWNLKLRVVIHNILDNAPVGISPPALVESKSKILLHDWQPNGASLVRSDGLLLSRSREEVQINASSKHAPGDVARTEKDLLAVDVPVVNSVGVRHVVLIRCIRSIGSDQS